MRRIVITCILCIPAMSWSLLSCNSDERIELDDSLQSFFPLAEGNYWEYSKTYFKSNGERSAETRVYWQADSCCYYISKLELSPDSIDLGRDYLIENEDGWIYRAGSYKLLSTEYLERSPDSLYLVATRNDVTPLEHYLYGGKVRLNTEFGNRECIKTLTIIYYQNQRIEQYRWFCKGLGEYQCDNLKIEELKSGEDGNTYLTRTVLSEYRLE
jgi:hypothetical protein